MQRRERVFGALHEPTPATPIAIVPRSGGEHDPLDEHDNGAKTGSGPHGVGLTLDRAALHPTVRTWHRPSRTRKPTRQRLLSGLPAHGGWLRPPGAPSRIATDRARCPTARARGENGMERSNRAGPARSGSEPHGAVPGPVRSRRQTRSVPVSHPQER